MYSDKIGQTMLTACGGGYAPPPFALRTSEALMTPLAMKLQPGSKTFRIFPLNKEEPGEARIFLGYEFPHPGLIHEVTAVAVREIPLVFVVGILRVHFPEENGFEFVRARWMQVGSLQSRSIR